MSQVQSLSCLQRLGKTVEFAGKRPQDHRRRTSEQRSRVRFSFVLPTPARAAGRGGSSPSSRKSASTKKTTRSKKRVLSSPKRRDRYRASPRGGSEVGYRAGLSRRRSRVQVPSASPRRRAAAEEAAVFFVCGVAFRDRRARATPSSTRRQRRRAQWKLLKRLAKDVTTLR